jgi:hypothetical protein
LPSASEQSAADRMQAVLFVPPQSAGPRFEPVCAHHQKIKDLPTALKPQTRNDQRADNVSDNNRRISLSL